ncbi:MAG: hypothetical protein ABIZ72_11130 [Candidatus Limnocylindrales bacterium]
MHDLPLEQKLRATLQAEGDRLPLTITPAELERRLALRRRGGFSPIASLGLAAAVGIGLLGLVGLAGGWFEQRTAVVPPLPSPVTVATATDAPSDPASPLAAPLLPSLDDFLATHDPATIVQAQAMGPAAGPAADAAPEVRWVGFAPLTIAGSYAVEIACLGADDLQLQIVSADPGVPGRSWPFVCGGSPSARLVDVAAGDGIGIFASRPASWRVAVLAPSRPVGHATEIAAIPLPVDRDIILDVTSEAATPDYVPTGTGGGMWLPQEVATVANRPAYRVQVTCAGPNPIRYAFGTFYDEQNPPEPLPDDHSTTQVECDGALHEDVLDVPLIDGARFIVTSDPQTVWRIRVTVDKPPISLAPDVPGWTMSTGSGPNWMTRREAGASDLIGGEKGEPIRVVITCAGDATLTGTIDWGSPIGTKLDPYSIDCSADSPNQTLVRVYPSVAGYVQVTFDAGGRTIWLAITGQAPGPAVPVR